MRHFVSAAICVIVSLALLVTAMRFVSDFWLFSAIHSLQLHLTAGCILAMLVGLLLWRHVFPLALLVASVLLFAHGLWLTRELAQPGLPAAEAPAVRLMSINILMTNFDNAARIRDAILDSGADVVNVMEAEPLIGEIDNLSTVYPHRIGCGVMTDGCDLMVLSRTPLTSPAIVTLSDLFGERMMLAQVTFAGRPIHVVAIHTTKPYFDTFQSTELENAANVLTRLKGPLILSGDFNASTLAPNIRGFLHRTDLRTASFEPPTWPDWAGWLGVPLDHVYARAPMAIRSLQRLPDPLGSNHYGLMADIVLDTP